MSVRRDKEVSLTRLAPLGHDPVSSLWARLRRGVRLVRRQAGQAGDVGAHPPLDLGHEGPVRRVEGVVEVEDPGVDARQVGADFRLTAHG